MHYVTIPEHKLSHHGLICGDTGAGKSQLFQQFMYYARARGDAAVVLDSKNEFLPQFYIPKYDHILAPHDNRTSYWNIGAEVTDMADAISLMRAAFPHDPKAPASNFWVDMSTNVTAYVLSHTHPRPTTYEFGDWLAWPPEIFKRIKGSEHEWSFTKAYIGQKSAIIATMNQYARPLRMMPREQEDRKYLNINEWVENPDAWIYLPNTQDVREAMLPLQTLWLDRILQKLMKRGPRADGRRVWIFLDELASLNTLPQLFSAITEMRSSGHPLVMGIQNLGDLDRLYGEQARTIVSQSYTKIILATSEYRSRDLLSHMIGKQWRVRYEPSDSYTNMRHTHSYGRREYERDCVTESEIGKFNDLDGIFLQRGEATKIRIPYMKPIQRQPAHVTRLIPEMPVRMDAPDPEFDPQPVKRRKRRSEHNPFVVMTIPTQPGDADAGNGQ